MPTSKNNDTGWLEDFTTNIYVSRCSPMQLQLAGASIAMTFVGGRGNHCQNKTWEQSYHHGAHSPQLHMGRYRRPLLGCLPALESTQERRVGEGCWGVLHQDVLDSVKEYLWLKWPFAQPEEQHRQTPASVPQPDAWLKFVAANYCKHEGFTPLKEDSCKGMLAIVRDAHHQALVAVAMLEDRIEWLSFSVSWQCSSSH